MLETIENKVNDVINYIIGKDLEDITYNEYRILDTKLKELKYEVERKGHNEKMMKTMSECLFSGIGSSSIPPALPNE